LVYAAHRACIGDGGLMQISYEQVRQLYYQNSQFGFYPCWAGALQVRTGGEDGGSAGLIIADKQLQTRGPTQPFVALHQRA